MTILALLGDLGFNDYEAKAYVGLVDAGECNGYELAKAAGIPRANVYAVLERLVARGAARRIDTPDGTRFTAIAPSRLLTQLQHQHQRTVAAASEAMAELGRSATVASAFNLRSRAELLAHAVGEIDAAEKSLLVAIQPVEAALLATPLQHARERGVAITTLCLEACAKECAGCQGQIHRLQMAPQGAARWLLLVVDRRQVLLGQFDAGAAEGLVTAQRLVVELAETYIRQSLTLALLGNELADRFDGLLSLQARRLLNDFYPGGDFLTHLRSLGETASA